MTSSPEATRYSASGSACTARRTSTPRIPRGRTRAAGATLAVADAAGAVVALVHPAADAAVPADERTLVPVDAVARGVAAGRVLPAGLRGVDVLRAVQADPDAEYLVASGEDVIGVLRGADVAELLAARETSR